MKGNIQIISHVDHANTIMQAAIDSVIEKERGVSITSVEVEPMILTNPYIDIVEPFPKSGRENRREKRSKNRVDKYGNKRK
jgi:hypothetical protein